MTQNDNLIKRLHELGWSGKFSLLHFQDSHKRKGHDVGWSWAFCAGADFRGRVMFSSSTSSMILSSKTIYYMISKSARALQGIWLRNKAFYYLCFSCHLLRNRVSRPCLFLGFFPVFDHSSFRFLQFSLSSLILKEDGETGAMDFPFTEPVLPSFVNLISLRSSIAPHIFFNLQWWLS